MIKTGTIDRNTIFISNKPDANVFSFAKKIGNKQIKIEILVNPGKPNKLNGSGNIVIQ